VKGAGIRGRKTAGGRAVAAAAAVLACAATLAACGSGSDGGDDQDAPIVRSAATRADAGPYGGLTARQELEKAEDAMRGASAMTVVIDQSAGGHRMHMKAAVTDGAGCDLTIQQDSDVVQVVGTRTDTYVQADPAFWRAHGGPDGRHIATALAGKWLRIDARPSATSFRTYCSVTALIDSGSSDTGAGTVRRGRPAEVGGTPAVTVVHARNGFTSTAYIAATGVPYILRSYTVGTGGNAGKSGTTVFSGFGRAPRIAAPPADLTVDSRTLGTAHLSV
jgi:hypothetical protein